MFYNHKSEAIFKPFSIVAEKYKKVENLIMATFDRKTFIIPGLNQD